MILVLMSSPVPIPANVFIGGAGKLRTLRINNIPSSYCVAGKEDTFLDLLPATLGKRSSQGIEIGLLFFLVEMGMGESMNAVLPARGCNRTDRAIFSEYEEKVD